MKRKTRSEYLPIFYCVGIFIIFVLTIVSLFSFIKALSYCEPNGIENQHHYADSLQVEELMNEIKVLQMKIDSLEVTLSHDSIIVRKYIKDEKDSCLIVNNVTNVH